MRRGPNKLPAAVLQFELRLFVSRFLIWRPQGDPIPGYILFGMADAGSVSKTTLLPYCQQKVSTLATFDEDAQCNRGLLFRDVIGIDSSGVNACSGGVDVSFRSGRRISNLCSTISASRRTTSWSPELPFFPLPSHSNHLALFIGNWDCSVRLVLGASTRGASWHLRLSVPMLWFESFCVFGEPQQGRVFSPYFRSREKFERNQYSRGVQSILERMVTRDCAVIIAPV